MSTTTHEDQIATTQSSAHDSRDSSPTRALEEKSASPGQKPSNETDAEQDRDLNPKELANDTEMYFPEGGLQAW